MEEKKTMFGYLAEIMVVFGVAILALNLFCLMFGEKAQGFSGLFALGGQGISVKVVFQFLCTSVLIVGFRFLFFTDVLIGEMAVWLRTVCMLGAVLLTIAAFIVAFHWFPANMWQPWVMFFVCFGISFLCSLAVMVLKERAENRKMEEALEKIKKSGK